MYFMRKKLEFEENWLISNFKQQSENNAQNNTISSYKFIHSYKNISNRIIRH